MSSIETRLRKLEAADPNRAARLFVIEGDTPAERQGQIDELIRSGEAGTQIAYSYRCHALGPEAGNWNEPNG